MPPPTVTAPCAGTSRGTQRIALECPSLSRGVTEKGKGQSPQRQGFMPAKGRGGEQEALPGAWELGDGALGALPAAGAA